MIWYGWVDVSLNHNAQAQARCNPSHHFQLPCVVQLLMFSLGHWCRLYRSNMYGTTKKIILYMIGIDAEVKISHICDYFLLIIIIK